MIYNFTKCESVIAKIMADSDSTETRQRVTDIREWIFEAIDKIGAPMQYISKESDEIKIEDNQIPLPSDLKVLDGVAYRRTPDSELVPMLKSVGVFKEPKRKEKPAIYQVCDENNYVVDEHYVEIKDHEHMKYKIPTTQYEMLHRATKTLSDTFASSKYDKSPQYFIKPGWLVSNKSEGFVKISYKAIAVDERGYPLIPDTSSYQEAVYWYVMMKLNFSKFLKGRLGGKGVNNPQNVYFYIQQQWNFYRNQAYAEAMMPTADDMRNIKNEWNQLIPDYSADDNFFIDSNERQSFYNNYYRGY